MAKQRHDSGWLKARKRETEALEREEKPASPERLAQKLVERGVCSASILGTYQPPKPKYEGS